MWVNLGVFKGVVEPSYVDVDEKERKKEVIGRNSPFQKSEEVIGRNSPFKKK